MQSFGGLFHSKITRAGTGVIEGCSCYLFIEMKCTLVRFPDVCNWIKFGRDC